MPSELAEVREWLRKADHDARGARRLLGDDAPITDAAAFHCQQAVEKLLKAYMVFRRESFPKIHDLEALMDRCSSLDPAFEPLRDRVEPLTAYAVRFRYPGPHDPTVDQVESALEVVDEVRRFILARLPADLRKRAPAPRTDPPGEHNPA